MRLPINFSIWSDFSEEINLNRLRFCWIPVSADYPMTCISQSLSA